MIKTAELQSKITNIYNHLYANAETRTPHGIANEVGKILHTASFIEKNRNSNRPAFEFTAKQIKDNLNGKASKVANEIRLQFSKMNEKWGFYDDEINLNDFDLAYTCCQLSGVLVTDKERDVFGDAVEIFRGQWAKQVGGQFFTDGLVTKLAMQLLEFNPQKGDDLVDICSGTGGFLLAGLNHIREQLKESEIPEEELEKILVPLAKTSLKGQEVDKEVCKVANATLTSRLGVSNKEYVQNGDSLLLNSKGQIRFDSHLCVASNPPFGTKITVKDHKILDNFDLAKVSSRSNTFFPIHKIAKRSPDILFVEQNVKLLVPGKGRLSIVLPYQILSGPQTMYVRDWLMRNTIIQSIIDLPGETFQPHTGTKTCLLTLKRRKSPINDLSEIEHYPIFMSIPKWIGHDRRGKPVYKKNVEGKPTNEILTDFPELYKAYTSFKNGEEPSKFHENSFTISSEDILSAELLQLNAQYHKPRKFDESLADKKDWDFVPLDDLITKIFYPGRFKRNYVDYSENAIPFFGGSDILQLWSWTNKWISSSHPKVKELSVEKDWILITRSGSTGIVSIVPEAWDGYAMSEHIIRIIPDERKISPYYLMGFLRSDYCQEIIAKGVFGSVIDEIDPSFLGKIKVPIPKSRKVLNELIKEISIAESARNNAILGTKTAVNNLNKFYSDSFRLQ